MKWTALPFYVIFLFLGACEDNPFFGDDKIAEREITELEKSGIDNVIRAYLSIGGFW